jgi:hypothetical protein
LKKRKLTASQAGADLDPTCRALYLSTDYTDYTDFRNWRVEIAVRAVSILVIGVIGVLCGTKNFLLCAPAKKTERVRNNYPQINAD